jgi:hypothetical protein
MATLIERASAANIELVPLSPALDDFNDDLQLLGAAPLIAKVGPQLRDDDRTRLRTPRG